MKLMKPRIDKAAPTSCRCSCFYCGEVTVISVISQKKKVGPVLSMVLGPIVWVTWLGRVNVEREIHATWRGQVKCRFEKTLFYFDFICLHRNALYEFTSPPPRVSLSNPTSLPLWWRTEHQRIYVVQSLFAACAEPMVVHWVQDKRTIRHSHWHSDKNVMKLKSFWHLVDY